MILYLMLKFPFPFGLILNELLTNSLKHAFPDGRRGEIKVKVHLEEDGGYFLSVEDNGIGLPKDLNLQKTGTLGMLIIKSLTEQINGELVLESNMGTKFTIFFNDQEEID